MHKSIRITIPEGVMFDALHLHRDPITGSIAFDWAPLERICEASAIDPSLLRDKHEDNVAGVLMNWYAAHLSNGGHPDTVMEQLLARRSRQNPSRPAKASSDAGQRGFSNSSAFQCTRKGW